MKKVFLVILLFVSSIGFSQSPNDTIIHKENIDIRYLEKLCMEVLNKYRLSKGVNILKVDSNLCKSSIKHSQWMEKNNKFQHSHSGVGENILSLSLSAGLTYKIMSEEIIESWIKSPPHNANMLDSGYKFMGLGVQIYHTKYKTRGFYVTLQLK